MTGIEPATYRFAVECSTSELHPLRFFLERKTLWPKRKCTTHIACRMHYLFIREFLRRLNVLTTMTGLEPATIRFVTENSSIELHGLNYKNCLPFNFGSFVLMWNRTTIYRFSVGCSPFELSGLLLRKTISILKISHIPIWSRTRVTGV